MNSGVDKFKKYLFSYEHNGAKWAFDIEATSPADAKARQEKIASANYDGELMASVYIPDVSLLRKMIKLFWR